MRTNSDKFIGHHPTLRNHKKSRSKTRTSLQFADANTCAYHTRCRFHPTAEAVGILAPKFIIHNS